MALGGDGAGQLSIAGSMVLLAAAIRYTAPRIEGLTNAVRILARDVRRSTGRAR